MQTQTSVQNYWVTFILSMKNCASLILILKKVELKCVTPVLYTYVLENMSCETFYSLMSVRWPWHLVAGAVLICGVWHWTIQCSWLTFLAILILPKLLKQNNKSLSSRSVQWDPCFDRYVYWVWFTKLLKRGKKNELQPTPPSPLSEWKPWRASYTIPILHSSNVFFLAAALLGNVTMEIRNYYPNSNLRVIYWKGCSLWGKDWRGRGNKLYEFTLMTRAWNTEELNYYLMTENGYKLYQW